MDKHRDIGTLNLSTLAKFRPQSHPVSYMEVKCYLKAKKLVEPILLLVFSKNLAGYVTFYFALCLILAYSNTVSTYEMLTTFI